MVLLQKRIKVTGNNQNHGTFQEFEITDKYLYIKTTTGFEIKIDGEEFHEFTSRLYKYFISLFEGEQH